MSVFPSLATVYTGTDDNASAGSASSAERPNRQLLSVTDNDPVVVTERYARITGIAGADIRMMFTRVVLREGIEPQP